MKIVSFILISYFSFAAPSSFKIHSTKIDESVKNCPKDEMALAKEALSLELAGMRWLNAKPSCFENLKMKYVHAQKNPDEAVSDVVKVKKGSAKIKSIKFDDDFYSYRVRFSILDAKGNKLEDGFSFMTNTKKGASKPETGCALISANPSKAFVSEDCLGK